MRSFDGDLYGDPFTLPERPLLFHSNIREGVEETVGKLMKCLATLEGLGKTRAVMDDGLRSESDEAFDVVGVKRLD